MKLLLSLLSGASVAFCASAAAVQAQPAATPQVKTKGDASEVICERQTVLGSRLAHRKVCMTRSQWEESRREDRKTIEKIQTERGVIGPEPAGPGG
jgi:invasion protein IalB